MTTPLSETLTGQAPDLSALFTREHTLLVVDDNSTNLAVVVDFLKVHAFRVLVARDGESALERTLYTQPDLILLDVMMPGIDGFETCKRLKANPETCDIPVIFMTALANPEEKIRGLAAGAVDYVTKPLYLEEVLARVTTHLRMRDLMRHLQRRTLQLEAAHQVARHVTAMLDLERLLAEVCGMIRVKFNYYYVSIWLAQGTQGTPNHRLTLQAASARNGDTPIPLETSLAFDQEISVVATAQRTGQYYLCTDTNTDAHYMAVPELPKTRAEIALPLNAGPQAIGVLDIQSDVVRAFDLEDVSVLQTMADEIAIAIYNASLYAEVRRFNMQLEQMVQARTEELDKAYHTLAKLDRTKSDFIKVAAHELRTPLTLIKGYAQLLTNMLVDRPEVSTQLQGILTGQMRLYEIINSMLDVSKIDSQTLTVIAEPTHLAEVIGLVCHEFSTALRERHLTLTLTGLDDLPSLMLDPDLMRKLFHHLVINAIKYTPDGGTLTVSGAVIRDASTEPAVEIQVRDTGIGIDPEHQELIFEKFYQTGKVQLHSSGLTSFKGGGPGLGLAIVRGIARAHGAAIWAESTRYDEQNFPGSIFHVRFPLTLRAPHSL